MKIKGHASYIGTGGFNSYSRHFFRALYKLYPDVFVRNYSHDDSALNLLNDVDKKILSERTLSNDSGRSEYPMQWNSKILDEHPNADKINIIINEVNHYYFYEHYNGKKIAYTMWETTRFPENFIEQLKTFDQVWALTEWQKQCFIEQGIQADKIFIVPGGVDEDFYPEEVELPDYDGRFKFLLFGRWDYRKSVTEIIQTFLKTFSKDEPVDFIVSVDNPFSVDGMHSTEERLKHYGFDDARIKVKHFVSREDYIKYIKKGHVLVSCARGEGWNLPLIEAMASGTPAIYSDWGAQLQFAAGRGFPVKITGTNLASLGKLYAFAGDVPGEYCEPDFYDLGKVMRHVYENYDICKSIALHESNFIIENFSWDCSARAAKVAIDALQPEVRTHVDLPIKAHTAYIGTTGYNSHARGFFRELYKQCPSLLIRNGTVNDSALNLLNDVDKAILSEQTYFNPNGRSDYPMQWNSEILDKDRFGKKIHLILDEVNNYYFYENYNGKKIAYTVWESTKLPEQFAKKLCEFDQVWVPSHWQKQCFIEQGISSDSIYVIPEAVDSDFYPDDVELDEYNDGRFKFLVVGRWEHRKATHEIIMTFLETFSKDEPVDLIISVDNIFATDGMNSTEERLEKYCLQDARIKIKHFLKREDYVKYIKKGHVFVSCSRGEGWNIPLIEAMASGIPSIYADWGGQLEYAAGRGFPVDITGLYEADKTGRITGEYCEPDFDALNRVMRYIYENYDVCKEKALRESVEVREQFTWQRSAMNAKCAIDILQLQDARQQSQTIALGIIWIGQLPEYFKYFLETAKNNDTIDFIIITDQNTDHLGAVSNIKYVKTSVDDIQKRVQLKTGYNYILPNNKKISDFKTLQFDLFNEEFSGYDYVGFVDCDVLFGDIREFISKYLGTYDIISAGAEIPEHYNRIVGPFTLFKNEERLHTLYKSVPDYLTHLNSPKVVCFEEDAFDAYVKQRADIKMKVVTECQNLEGAHFIFNAKVTNKKLYVNGIERMLYHFIYKNQTKIYNIDGELITKKSKIYLDDFCWLLYCTENYEPIVRTAIKSIEDNSNRKCILYTIGYESTIESDSLYKKIMIKPDMQKLDARQGEMNRQLNTVYKLIVFCEACKLQDVNTLIFVDSDAFLLNNADSITRYIPLIKNYPLINSHVHDVMYANDMTDSGENLITTSFLEKYMNVPVTIRPRRHSNVVLFDKRSGWFFEEIMKFFIDNIHLEMRKYFRLGDEDLLNIFLSKYNFDQSAIPVLDAEIY